MSQDALQIVLCTAPPNEASGLARAVVEERLAACVNIIPSITSVYRWEGEVHEDGEALLVIKTTAGGLDALQERLTALHSYDVPEVLALPVSGGSKPYADWVREALKIE